MASDSPPFIASALSIAPTGLLTLADSSYPATDGRGPQREGWECFPWDKFKGFVINERSNRSGWTWEHGFDVKRHNNSSHWICWHCVTRRSPQPAIFAAAGTANQAKHLVNEHGVHDPTGKRPAKRAKVSIAERLHMDVTKPAEQAVVNRLIQSFNPTYFQELLVDWITHDNVPFRKVESHHFHRLMEYTNPACASSLPSHPTVRKWLLNEFNRHRGIVTELLHGSPGFIHLSFDGWTSRNHKSLLGVIVHFLSSNGKLRQFTIGLPQLEGHHGVDMAEEVAQIIADWGIGNKIGYFITDNAFNNDTAIDQLADEFGFNAKQRRLRCIGHIINLVVRQILFGVDFDLFEQDCHDARDLLAEHRHWRQKGALGKLHNVIHAIARSESLRAKLRRLQQAGQPAGEGDAVTYELVLDNATRWNSFEAMIERSIKLRYFIDAILLNEVSEWKAYILRARADGREIKRKQPILVDDYLTADDWATINEYHSILQPFKEVSIRLQGNPTQGQFGALWEVLPVMEFLLGHLEEVKDRNDVYPEEHFKINVELGWAKLNEYYTLLDDTPAYVAALVLHPAFRWTWIEKHWADRPEWIASAKTSVNQLWKGQYQLTQATDEASDERPLRRIRDETTSFASWLQSSTAKPLIPTTSDEYTTWQTDTSPLDTEQRNPIEYWLLRQKQYPRLSRMALDLFSIPAMSTEVERIFSLAGQMITPLRSRLEGNTIAVAQILRSWVGAGIIKR